MKHCPVCETAYPSHHTNCTTDGALLVETHELEPGTVIRNKYRIARKLGRGGMGTVYLAEHILLGRQRALKFISGELSHDPRFLKRFRMEAQAAIELRHPNVAEVVDLDQAEDGTPFIAMEYVEGPDLRSEVNLGAFPVVRALAVARGVALGLGAAHAKGIVHRDVKPENILIARAHGADETPKLLDFGIAAMKDTPTALSRTRGMMLTPEYAAPEQWKGMPSDQMDGRTDLYALGGVLYEMLTASTCFHSHSTEGWMFHHLQGERGAPSQVRPELTQWVGLDSLVMRTLAMDREVRPRDVAEFVRELDGVRAPGTGPAARRTEVAGQGRAATVIMPGAGGFGRYAATRVEMQLPEPTVDPPLFQAVGEQAGGNGEPESKRRRLAWGALVLAFVAMVGVGGYLLSHRGPSATATTPVSPASTDLPQSGAEPLADTTGGTKSAPPKSSGGRGTQPIGSAPQPAMLTVSCDMPCNWKLNGRAQERLAAGQSQTVAAGPGGSATVEAQAADERLTVQQKTVTLRAGVRQEADFSFRMELASLMMKINGLSETADTRQRNGDDPGAVAALDEAMRSSPDSNVSSRLQQKKDQVMAECRNLGISCN